MKIRSRVFLILAIVVSGIIAALPFRRPQEVDLTPLPNVSPTDDQIVRRHVTLPASPLRERSPAVSIDAQDGNPADPGMRMIAPAIRASSALDSGSPPPELDPLYQPMLDPIGLIARTHETEQRLARLDPTIPRVVSQGEEDASRNDSDVVADARHLIPGGDGYPPASEPGTSRLWQRMRSAVTEPADRELDADDESTTPIVMQHVIVDGDTLPRIALRYLGREDRYLEIFDANRDVLPAPDVLPLGARLKITIATARPTVVDGSPAPASRTSAEDEPLVPLTWEPR